MPRKCFNTKEGRVCFNTSSKKKRKSKGKKRKAPSMAGLRKRNCAGLKRNGRLKKGYKWKKGARCPTKVR